MIRIITNRIKTPDGTILTSRTQHDCIAHRDMITGNVYSVDGGLAHRSRSGPDDCEDLSVMSDAPFEVVRRNMEWGAKDKDGNVIWKTLYLMGNEHIRNILKTQKLLSEHYKMLFVQELNYRHDRKINIE